MLTLKEFVFNVTVWDPFHGETPLSTVRVDWIALLCVVGTLILTPIVTTPLRASARHFPELFRSPWVALARYSWSEKKMTTNAGTGTHAQNTLLAQTKANFRRVPGVRLTQIVGTPGLCQTLLLFLDSKSLVALAGCGQSCAFAVRTATRLQMARLGSGPAPRRPFKRTEIFSDELAVHPSVRGCAQMYGALVALGFKALAENSTCEHVRCPDAHAPRPGPHTDRFDGQTLSWCSKSLPAEEGPPALRDREDLRQHYNPDVRGAHSRGWVAALPRNAPMRSLQMNARHRKLDSALRTYVQTRHRLPLVHFPLDVLDKASPSWLMAGITVPFLLALEVGFTLLILYNSSMRDLDVLTALCVFVATEVSRRNRGRSPSASPPPNGSNPAPPGNSSRDTSQIRMHWFVTGVICSFRSGARFNAARLILETSNVNGNPPLTLESLTSPLTLYVMFECIARESLLGFNLFYALGFSSSAWPSLVSLLCTCDAIHSMALVHLLFSHVFWARDLLRFCPLAFVTLIGLCCLAFCTMLVFVLWSRLLHCVPPLRPAAFWCGDMAHRVGALLVDPRGLTLAIKFCVAASAIWPIVATRSWAFLGVASALCTFILLLGLYADSIRATSDRVVSYAMQRLARVLLGRAARRGAQQLQDLHLALSIPRPVQIDACAAAVPALNRRAPSHSTAVAAAEPVAVAATKGFVKTPFQAPSCDTRKIDLTDTRSAGATDARKIYLTEAFLAPTVQGMRRMAVWVPFRQMQDFPRFRDAAAAAPETPTPALAFDMCEGDPNRGHSPALCTGHALKMPLLLARAPQRAPREPCASVVVRRLDSSPVPLAATIFPTALGGRGPSSNMRAEHRAQQVEGVHPRGTKRKTMSQGEPRALHGESQVDHKRETRQKV